MRDEYLPYGHQWIDESDIQSVAEVLRADRITTGGYVSQFEKVVASYCGAKYAVAVSSGTAALHCACYVAGISKDDEVITTPITFFADVACVVFCGGIPKLADIKASTMNIDPHKVKQVITSKTKAIIPVDFAGHPADLDEINTLAKEHGLVVIEDACHALGAEYKGRKIGSLSDMTVLSFHPVKHITSGEGGMILTDNEEYYEKMRRFRNHNIVHGLHHWEYKIYDVGYNYRLTDIQCALGISQMGKLDSFVARRREIARMYNDAFTSIKGIITPTELRHIKSSYHLYVIQLRSVNRDKFLEAIVAKKIGGQIHYIPIHYQPYMQMVWGYKHGDFPKAERYYRRAVSLPIFPKMTDSDVRDVIEAVKEEVSDGGK